MNHEVSSLVDDAAIGIHPPSYRLPASARVGRARIAVSELARSLDFYTRVIGLQVLERETRLARLGAHGSQVVLLELEELSNVEPIGRRSRLGLYHTAFLLPSRAALSSFVQHLNGLHVYFGSGDHLYSEAMYLTDPDGLSVEVYADRSRSEWTIDNREIVSATEPVRFDLLPKVPENSWEGMPAGTTMGHVHFYVGDLEKAASFYHAGLGLDIVTWRYPGALFTSAGGYHHHVGLNVWVADSPVAAATDARLLFWELVLPTEQERERAAKSMADTGFPAVPSATGALMFTDPWGITVALTVRSGHVH
ncbi:MAG: VOC family protein [Acidobacteriaceae bacterium]